MKKIFRSCCKFIFVAVCVFGTFAFAGGVTKDIVNPVFQVSTLQALVAGEYDGAISIAALLEKGDMGLGTFDKLDGEMIVWNGKVYKGKIDGKVYLIGDEATTPFANVATIGSAAPMKSSFSGGFAALKAELNRIYPEENVPVLFCIAGEFLSLTYRSVPEQEKPYPVLTEVVKHQAVFKKSAISGVLVGFRFPSYMSGMNVHGFHLHFLSADKKFGGHLFDVESGSIEVRARALNGIEVFLPESIKQAQVDKVDSNNAVDTVEKLKTE